MAVTLRFDQFDLFVHSQRPSKKIQQGDLDLFFWGALPILACYGGRWLVEIAVRESVESYGLGQDRCRRYERIVGANAFRLIMAAAQGLWFAQQLGQGQAVDLIRYRPWYRQKRAPSGFDIMWACRERLFAEGIMPTVGFWEKVGVIELVSPSALPRTA